MENQNQQKSKTKKIIDIVVNVVLWLFVIFAIIVTVIAVSAGGNKKNVPTVGGKCYLSVQSNSMNAAKPDWVGSDKPKGFKKGDLIFATYIAEKPEEIAKLEKGDVISFEYDIDGDGKIASGEVNTHRIVEIHYKADGTTVDYYETKGDNNAAGTEEVYASRIVAKYTGKKIGGFGGVLDFLRSKLGFALCIILPLFLFFGYELFVFIKTFIAVKNEGKKVITAEDEALIKQRAIEEYLKLQGQSATSEPQAEENNKHEQNDSAEKEY